MKLVASVRLEVVEEYEGEWGESGHLYALTARIEAALAGMNYRFMAIGTRRADVTALGMPQLASQDNPES